MHKSQGLIRVPAAAVKVAKGRSDKMLRPDGHDACVRAARAEARKVVPALHADDPMFYCHGIPARPAGKRVVKKG